MKTIPDYLDWLNDLTGRSIDQKTGESIQRLIALLETLVERNVFSKDASKMLQRLESMMFKVERQPERTKYFVDRCFSDLLGISAKFFRLVKKRHYLNEWVANGMSFGVVLGVLAYSFTRDAIYIALGIPVGLAIGVAIGGVLERKAKQEGRILEVS